MSNDNNTQPQEDIKEVETAEQTASATEASETLGEVLESKVEVAPRPKEKPKTVPIDVFLDLKKELKELKNAKNESVTSDSSIDSLTSEFPDVDPTFIKKLANAVKNSTVQDFEEKYSLKISELENVSKRESQNKKFDDLYNKTIEAMPYFKDVANKDIIKQLALNPDNAKKTFPQLMEEVYGGSVQGKRTMETAQPNGGRADETVDFAQAGNPAVYARIKADPKLRKQYNDYVQKNLNI